MAKLLRIITLQVPAGKANPAPPIGTALGPTGIPIQDFCKQFNDQTSSMEPGMVVTVKISIFDDRSFKFVIKSSPASVLIKKALGLGKGSAKPHTDKVGTLSKSQLEEIAKMKMEDLNANDIDAAMKIIAGAARSMGVKVEV